MLGARVRRVFDRFDGVTASRVDRLRVQRIASCERFEPPTHRYHCRGRIASATLHHSGQRE